MVLRSQGLFACVLAVCLLWATSVCACMLGGGHDRVGGTGATCVEKGSGGSGEVLRGCCRHHSHKGSGPCNDPMCEHCHGTLVSQAMQPVDLSSVNPHLSVVHFSFVPVFVALIGPAPRADELNLHHPLPPPERCTLLRLHCALVV